jgi:hypothetical protein
MGTRRDIEHRTSDIQHRMFAVEALWLFSPLTPLKGEGDGKRWLEPPYVGCYIYGGMA